MNLHVVHANIILRYLHRYRRKMTLSVLNAEVKIYRKPTVFFMWGAMCPIPVPGRGRVVTGVVGRVRVRVRGDDWI